MLWLIIAFIAFAVVLCAMFSCSLSTDYWEDEDD
jgi:hypothetical protein